MEWCGDFTALVLRFTDRQAKIEGIPHDAALLNGTPLSPNFKLGITFNAR
jgi:hypothetical protein